VSMGQTMSYSDNLENNLKALENQEERDPVKVQRERERREADKKAAVLRAPYAEALKSSAFTNALLTQCRAIGQGQRTHVRFTWVGETLRLDARQSEKDKRMELVPMPEGIVAVFSVDGLETKRAKVNLEKDDPAAFAKKWLE
jgi:hypothetical protein